MGQTKIPPTEASLLMSLEMVFGAILGYLVLGENLTGFEFIGVILMSTGIVLAQLPSPWKLGPILGSKK